MSFVKWYNCPEEKQERKGAESDDGSKVLSRMEQRRAVSEGRHKLMTERSGTYRIQDKEPLKKEWE